MIARALAANSRLIIFNEPTRGIDIKSKAEIYALLGELANGRADVIFISQEVTKVVGMSDRVLIWKDGNIVRDLKRDELTKKCVLGLIPRRLSDKHDASRR